MIYATKQDVFEVVAKHLLSQGTRAVALGTNECQYRGANGTKCAAGVLIADDQYEKKMEGTTVIGLRPRYPGRLSWPEELDGFVMRLQDVHDYQSPMLWDIRLKDVAMSEGLKWPLE